MFDLHELATPPSHSGQAASHEDVDARQALAWQIGAHGRRDSR
jgi:hypothetical protein